MERAATSGVTVRTKVHVTLRPASVSASGVGMGRTVTPSAEEINMGSTATKTVPSALTVSRDILIVSQVTQ